MLSHRYVRLLKSIGVFVFVGLFCIQCQDGITSFSERLELDPALVPVEGEVPPGTENFNTSGTTGNPEVDDAIRSGEIPPPNRTDGRWDICHVPGGNPNARHEMIVGPNAVLTHFREHGDYLAPCL